MTKVKVFPQTDRSKTWCPRKSVSGGIKQTNLNVIFHKTRDNYIHFLWITGQQRQFYLVETTKMPVISWQMNYYYTMFQQKYQGNNTKYNSNEKLDAHMQHVQPICQSIYIVFLTLWPWHIESLVLYATSTYYSKHF